MNPRSAIKTDPFADEQHRIDTLANPLTESESRIDFAAWATEIDRAAARPASPQSRGYAIPNRDDSAHSGFETPVQALASFAITMMVACYNLKQLAYFQKFGNQAL